MFETKIIIVVNKGIVEQVFSNNKDIYVRVLDRDEMDPNITDRDDLERQITECHEIPV